MTEDPAVVTPDEAADRAEEAIVDAVKAHQERVATITESIQTELVALGHQVDADVRLVDGQPILLFVLPSTSFAPTATDYLNIGYGPTGSHSAYRGLAADMKPADIAKQISAYVKEKAS